ncbi:MAG: ribosome biogenesis GTP-binding protein YihA/YsxC [Desulfovibrionaceae bacterium]
MSINKHHIQSSLLATIYNKKQLSFFGEEYENLPHVVFVGRSNVGKSSLVNTILQRKKLAKVSATPGKTRSINIYTPHGYPFYIADLPGYGYAKCSKDEQRTWLDFIAFYLEEAYFEKHVILLLDSRRLPQKSDRELLQYMYTLQLRVTPVFTKMDKTTQKERNTTIMAWKKHSMSTFFQTSTLKKTGLDTLWKHITESI